MELPTEIIYEIHCHFPFQSYIWCLSKSTRKYWQDRYIDLSDPEPEDRNKTPDMVKCPRWLCSIVFVTYKHIILKAKFLILPNTDFIYGLNGQFKNIGWVNFCGNYIPIDVYSNFSHANFYNFYVKLFYPINVKSIVKKYFPQHSQLISNFHGTREWDHMDYVLINDKKMVFFIYEDLLINRDPVIYDIKHMEILSVRRTDKVRKTIKTLIGLNFEYCKLNYANREACNAYVSQILIQAPHFFNGKEKRLRDNRIGFV